MKKLATFVLAVSLLAGCSSHSHDADTGEHDGVARTVWTKSTELFMEYDPPAAGAEAEFLVHLTALKNFKPLVDVPLTMTFTSGAGDQTTATIDRPVRPGIYKTSVLFKQPGTYTLKASYEGRDGSDTVVVDGIEVRDPKEKAVASEQSLGETGTGISLLKEQQWTVEFMTGVPVIQSISSFFTASGEVVPMANGDVTISAPVAGIMSSASAIAHLGKKVSPRETLGVIEPPLSGQGGMGHLNASHAEAKGKLALAEK